MRKCSKGQEQQILPDKVLYLIIDQCDLLEQIRLRALNTSVRDYVNNKLSQVGGFLKTK